MGFSIVFLFYEKGGVLFEEEIYNPIIIYNLLATKSPLVPYIYFSHCCNAMTLSFVFLFYAKLGWGILKMKLTILL